MLTTPAAPERAALEGSAHLIAEFGLSFADVHTIIQGTTFSMAFLFRPVIDEFRG